MKRSANMLPLALMGCSLTLMVALQFFWIRSSYEKAFYDFRRETSILFRNTVTDIRLAYFLKNLVPMPADSVGAEIADTVMLRTSNGAAPFKGVLRHARKIDVIVSAEADSAAKPFHEPAFVENLAVHQKGAGQRVYVRFTPDTLRTDTLREVYQTALTAARIDVPFVIRRLDFDVPDTELNPMASILFDNHSDLPPKGARAEEYVNVFSDTVATEMVRFNPMRRYSASLTGVRSLLLKKITPQILFAVFLTIVTATAFGFMYRSIRSQQKLMAMKNDFISNITHELKTPVATVSVALEALKDFQAKDNPRLIEEYLDIAQGELNRLSQMTDKILKASAWEGRGVEYTPERTDVDAIVRQVLASLKLVFEKRQAKVHYVKEGSDFYVQGSPLHLTNVVFNLIDNALKYSNGHPQLSIALQQTPASRVLTIKDEGIGIAPEYQQKIFEKFFRVPSGDVHNTKGYGLGLSYVASVVERHGGKIDVESTEGKGSVFTIVLPA